MIYKSKLYRKVYSKAVEFVESICGHENPTESLTNFQALVRAFEIRGEQQPQRNENERTMDYVIRCAVALGFDAQTMIEREEAKEARKKANPKSRNMLFQQRMCTPVTTLPGGGAVSRYPTTEEKNAFYDSWEWRQLRMEVLKQYGRRCMCCGATPNDFDMTGEPVCITVDHIKPLSKFWDLRLDRSNLSVLCHECNKGKGNWDYTDWRCDPA